jgi:putative transposase
MLTAHGVSTRQAASLTGLVRSTASRRRTAASALTPAVCTEPAVEPANKLTDAERRRVLEVLTSDRFVDLAPLQIYVQLLDEGVYLCSVSTMYRVLAQNTLVAERRRLARHPAQVCPELVATAPQQVYSWDITKLAGPVKGTYFDAYVMIDIYSRYLVGVHVHAHESGVLAKELMEQIFTVHGVPQVVHADRGTSMTSKTVAALLADLGVTRSHSRPRVSNDNPYSESLFKTLKYGPAFPERFGSLCEARQFMDTFTDWYNHEHRHRHRFAHARRRALRVGHRQSRRPAHGTDPSPRPTPAPLRHRRHAEDPRPTRHRLDQPTSPEHHPGDRHDSRLTPTGLIHLEKFRSGNMLQTNFSAHVVGQRNPPDTVWGCGNPPRYASVDAMASFHRL